MALLASVTLDFGHGHALQAELGKGLAHLIELEWLDDRHHQLHLFPPPCGGFSVLAWVVPRQPERRVKPRANSAATQQFLGFERSSSGSAPTWDSHLSQAKPIIQAKISVCL